MGMCVSVFVRPTVLAQARRLLTIQQLYDTGTGLNAIPVLTTASASSAYKQAVRELCFHAGPGLRKEYLLHFARRGTLHATEYKALGFSIDGFGEIPSVVLGRLSKSERADVLRDYGRAVYDNERCSLHVIACVILRHCIAVPSDQQAGAHIVVDVIRDVLHTSRDPETVLLDGVAAAVRAADIDLTSLFLAHIECSDVNDGRRRRLIAHLLTTCLTIGVTAGN